MIELDAELELDDFSTTAEIVVILKTFQLQTYFEKTKDNLM